MRQCHGFKRLLYPTQIVLDRSVTEHGPGVGVSKERCGKSQGQEMLHAGFRGQFQSHLFGKVRPYSGIAIEVELNPYFIICPRSSPPGFRAVWMFAYHFPARRSVA